MFKKIDVVHDNMRRTFVFHYNLQNTAFLDVILQISVKKRPVRQWHLYTKLFVFKHK